MEFFRFDTEEMLTLFTALKNYNSNCEEMCHLLMEDDSFEKEEKEKLLSYYAKEYNKSLKLISKIDERL